MHREWIVTFSCYMSKLHFLPNEKLYFSPIKKKNIYIYINKKIKNKKKIKKPNGKLMKDALIGIVLNKVWLIYKLHPFEFGVIYFLFFYS